MNNMLYSLSIYLGIFFLTIGVLYFYLHKLKKESDLNRNKVIIANEEGLHEPVSLHPVVNVNSCIKTGACIIACPEKDILGIIHGKAAVINASRCIGHGACVEACPTKAISLHLGTEQRGVQLPMIDEKFETNVRGIYIAGEIAGMGLIKNAVRQGKEAVDNLSEDLAQKGVFQYDLVIIGAGPAGIAASLAAKKHRLNFLTIEQDTLGGTVFSYPRQKIVMTSPMELPLYGTVKLQETSKNALLKLWQEVLTKNNIRIRENTKAFSIEPVEEHFKIMLSDEEEIVCSKVLLAIGRGGSPGKLHVPGEELAKVAYRLTEPEEIQNQHILIVGGGDTAIETAIALQRKNQVTISYRGQAFNRIKKTNFIKIEDLIRRNAIEVLYNSTVTSITPESVTLSMGEKNSAIRNDLVFVFIGGEFPTHFLEKAGIKLRTLKGEAIVKR